MADAENIIFEQTRNENTAVRSYYITIFVSLRILLNATIYPYMRACTDNDREK